MIVNYSRIKFIVILTITVTGMGLFILNFYEYNILMKLGIYQEKICSNPKLMQKFLEEQRDLNAVLKVKGETKTFLDCVVGEIDMDVIYLLKSQQSQISDQEKYKKILLLYYIDRNDLKNIEKILDQGIDLNLKYQKDVEYENIKNVVFPTNQITYYFCKKSSLLNEAIIRKNLKIVELLIDRGVEINEKCLIPDINLNNNSKNQVTPYNDRILTPLSKAIYLNNVEIVKLLLERGADFNAELFPLTLARAVNRNYHELLEVLLQYGLDSEEKNDFIFQHTYSYKSNRFNPNKVYRETKLEKYNSLQHFAKAKKRTVILELFAKYKKHD